MNVNLHSNIIPLIHSLLIISREGQMGPHILRISLFLGGVVLWLDLGEVRITPVVEPEVGPGKGMLHGEEGLVFFHEYAVAQWSEDGDVEVTHCFEGGGAA